MNKKKLLGIGLAAVMFAMAGTFAFAEGTEPMKPEPAVFAGSTDSDGEAPQITITVQPADQVVTRGESITLSVSATGENLSYQWYYKKKGQTSFSLWKGRVSPSETVTPNDTWDGIQLYCQITDSAGGSISSGTVTVTFAEALIITEQPRSRSIVKGDSVILYVRATGDGLKYQWYFRKAGQDSFSVWSKRTRSAETVTPNDSWDGIQLYCEVSDKYGRTLKSDTAVITFRQDDPDQKPWKGLKVSVLGDSISTYKGWSEHNTYYTPTKIPSVNSMWWKQVCDILGAEPLVIEARSSSCCAVSDAAWTKDIMPAVDDTRCRQLHKDGEEPDVIFIAMGVNDFQANVPLGDWDGHGELSSDDIRTWRGAYANTIQKIHERYPEALVFCLSPWYFVRGSSQTVNVNRHGTYQDYEDAMQEVCQLLQCVYIDASNFGFDRQNYSSQTFVFDDHAADGSLFHPNAVGQEILGRCVADEVRDKSAGYIRWLRQSKEG